MAIYDTDPNTTNRAEPIPQAPDEHIQRKSDGTTAITNKKDSSSGAYVSTKDAKVLVNDGTYNRVVMGLLPDGSYGLKVSKPSIDVLTAADTDLIFNSEQNVFKIVATMTVNSAAVTVTPGVGNWASTTTTVTTPHGLSYIPVSIGTSISFGVYYTLPMQINSVTAGAPSWVKIDCATDATNVYVATTVTAYNAASVSFGSVPVKIYLLQETAN